MAHEENPAQSGSDAPPDEVRGGGDTDFTEQSDRAHGKGSDANGVPEFDEVDGENRKRLYRETGATLVSRID